jgi:ketosteroid isomerase-like protein
MKPIIFIATLLLYILGCTQELSAQLTKEQEQQIKSEIKSIVDNYCTKWVGLDVEGIGTFYSPEMVVVVDTLLIDHDTYMKGWVDYAITSETIKIKPIYVDIRILDKDFVIATWCGNVDRIMKSGDLITAIPAKYTDVWKKIEGKWKIIYEHGSGRYITKKAVKN